MGDVVHERGMRVQLNRVSLRHLHYGQPSSTWLGTIIGGRHPHGWAERDWTVQSIDEHVMRVREIG